MLLIIMVKEKKQIMKTRTFQRTSKKLGGYLKDI